MHACQCRDANCRLPSCQKMKRVVQHTKICKRKTNGGCPICKQLIALCCYHAKHCQVCIVSSHMFSSDQLEHNPHSKETAKMSVPYTTYSSHVSAWTVCSPTTKADFLSHFVPFILSLCYVACTPLPSVGFPIVTDFPLAIPRADFFLKFSVIFLFAATQYITHFPLTLI